MLNISALFKSCDKFLSFFTTLYYFLPIILIKYPLKLLNYPKIGFFAFFSILRSFLFNLPPDKIDFEFFGLISLKNIT